MSAEVEQWLQELATAALVGSARRQPPIAPLALGVSPGDCSRTPEQRLLASAAVADAVTRAGARLHPPAVAARAAPVEVRQQVGDPATQLLHLLLTQPPVSKVARDELIVQWLQLADDNDERVAWWLLPALLDHAVGRPSVGGALGRTLGERGTWLLTLNPDWDHLATDVFPRGQALAPDWVDSWPTLPTAEAIEVFAMGRRQHATAARELLDSQWDVLSAKVRGAGLQSLRAGLSPADEPLLERALDDRAKTVREVAVTLLDQLPQSARGARMAERLRALAHVRRGLRATLEIDVPDDPDEVGIRDGLLVQTTAGVQPRNQWLATIIRGAPLSTWTEITGRSAAATVTMIRDAGVLTALTSTVVARHSEEWASALVASGSHDAQLVAHLPAAERRKRLIASLGGKTQSHETREALIGEPRPWDPVLGRAVLQALARPDGETLAVHLSAILPTALPLELAGDVSALVSSLGHEARARKVLSETLQIHAFRTSLTEAFS